MEDLIVNELHLIVIQLKYMLLIGTIIMCVYIARGL